MTIDSLVPSGTFADRHIGPTATTIAEMLATLGLDRLETLIDKAVPPNIRLQGGLNLGKGLSEAEALNELRTIAAQNRVCRSDRKSTRLNSSHRT